MEKEDSIVCEEGETKKKLSTEEHKSHTAAYLPFLCMAHYLQMDRERQKEEGKE